MQVQGGVGYTVGEADFGDLISPAAALNFGYQFTPVWGLRFGVSGWQAKGGWASPATTYKYNYLQGNVDVTLDLGNLFCGYKADRLFNPYFFVGVGLNGAFNNDEAVALHNQGYEMICGTRTRSVLPDVPDWVWLSVWLKRYSSTSKPMPT